MYNFGKSGFGPISEETLKNPAFEFFGVTFYRKLEGLDFETSFHYQKEFDKDNTKPKPGYHYNFGDTLKN